jgi:hypothetical protein
VFRLSERADQKITSFLIFAAENKRSTVLQIDRGGGGEILQIMARGRMSDIPFLIWRFIMID